MGNNGSFGGGGGGNCGNMTCNISDYKGQSCSGPNCVNSNFDIKFNSSGPCKIAETKMDMRCANAGNADGKFAPGENISVGISCTAAVKDA